MHDGQTDKNDTYDAIVIGTGFAGAVTAARLVQAGMKVCVLERGRKYEGNDFPMYPDAEALLDIDGGTKPAGAAPDLARWLWSIDQGIYDVRDLDDVVSVQAAGYGGGSLIYANVHLRTPDEVFQQGWPDAYRREDLDHYYDRVAYMLDVRPVPKAETLPKAAQLKGLTGKESLSGLVQAIDPPLAVTFATGEHAEDLKDKEREDLRKTREEERPWTKGPRQQRPCDMRGFCWLGCREGAKNSLDFNYLRIVEMDQEAHIHLGAEVHLIERLQAEEEDEFRYAVHYRDRLTDQNDQPKEVSKDDRPYKAKYVFLAAGAVNTTELLMRSKGELRPEKTAWDGLGTHYHPNADALAAVFDCAEPQDADRGPTITSALLHQKPRAARKGFLWAIDFELSKAWRADALAKSDDSVRKLAEKVERALLPEANIKIGSQDVPKIFLVEPPLFDVGGFGKESGVAMLVVDTDAPPGERRGQDLSVLVDGVWQDLGTIIGKPRKLEDWFLIEDGGFPTDIEPLLGILRSPLWLRRNRFKSDSDEKQIASEVGRAYGDPGPLRFPLATAMESFFGVPRRSTRVSTNLEDISERDELFAASPLKIPLNDILPPWFRDALAADRADLAKALAPMVGQMLEAVLDNVAERLVDRFDAMALTYDFTDSIGATLGDIPERQRADLIRGLLRQAIQVLWGSEVALAESVNKELIDRIPKDAYGLAGVLAPFAGWLLNYREGNGRTAVLLAMGRDQYRGRLDIDAATGRLTARLPKLLSPNAYAAQEQVLRAIAGEWQGELRTGPAWTALRRRITVHSQGGCPMCRCGAFDDPDDKGHGSETCVCAAVTKPNGEVIACDGLYVMDAAAFPTAVGVNPSATIAAVAEYKVEQFIENVLVKDLCPAARPGWLTAWEERRLPKKGVVEQWIGALKKEYGGDEHVLDPLARISKTSQGNPATEGLGLEFKESVYGYCTGADGNASIDWDMPAKFEKHKDKFTEAERQGINGKDTLRLELTAKIDDLDCFFRTQRRGFAVKIGIKENEDQENEDQKEEEEKTDPTERSIVVFNGATFDVDSDQSYLQFFLRLPPADEDGKNDHAKLGKPACFFRYHIVPKTKGQPFWIDGLKVLVDDPRFDIWQDLTTLYVERFEGDPAGRDRSPPSWRGILRVAPSDFFQQQLKSITITPDGADSARKSWAYGGFIRYFADELADVYLERRGLIGAMVRNLLDPSRGG